MPMRPNRLRELLNEGKPSLGTHVLATWPTITELVGQTAEALCSAGRPETALALVDSHLRRLPPGAAESHSGGWSRMVDRLIELLEAPS